MHEVGAIENRELLLAAHRLARDAGDRLLEAEALLNLGKPYAVFIQPRQALAELRTAEHIFRANGMQQRALACAVAHAQALCEAGEERNAIAAAHAVLPDPALSVEDRVHAHTVIAMSHMLLGELDAALRWLMDHAEPLARDSGQWKLIARSKWACGMVALNLVVCGRFPSLWHGLPGISKGVQSMPHPEAVLALFEEAKAVAPQGHHGSCIELCRQYALGLLADKVDAAQEIGALAARHLSSNPLFASRALYFKAMLLRHPARPQEDEAFAVLSQALLLTEQSGATSVMRDVLLQLSRVHEALGNTKPAFDAYTRFSSLIVNAVSPSLRPAPPPAAATMAAVVPRAGHDLGRHPLRNLEPAHVRRAIQFIEQQGLADIAVSDVVLHSRVSRRTLEVAFREHKATTIADYVKRYKMDAAASDLRRTDKHIETIAASVGYRSAAAFSREFRKRFGMSPSTWRRLYPPSGGGIPGAVRTD